MKVILDGIAAGATTRDALITWLHSVQNRPSALGTYGFDANGDTTLRTIGLYGIRNHALRFAAAITAAGAAAARRARTRRPSRLPGVAVRRPRAGARRRTPRRRG